MSRLLEIYDELKDSLSVTVKISHDESEKLIVRRLIEIRNSDVNRGQDMSHFDKVLKFWLSDGEFEKYVINKEEIK